jgi:hypothetical protein
VESSCESGNEPSGSIKSWEVLEKLHKWRPLVKGSFPFGWLVGWLGGWLVGWLVSYLVCQSVRNSTARLFIIPKTMRRMLESKSDTMDVVLTVATRYSKLRRGRGFENQ